MTINHTLGTKKMEILNYQDVAKTHSVVLAEYVLERLPEELKLQFKMKGVDSELVEKLINKWLAA